MGLIKYVVYMAVIRFMYRSCFNNDTGIDRVIITNATPGANEPLLSYAVFGAAFDKTSADTLTVYVNHAFVG